MKRYETEFKEKMIKLHLSEGRSRKSLENEYNLGNGTVAKWINSNRKECQTDISKQNQKDYYAENLKLIVCHYIIYHKAEIQRRKYTYCRNKQRRKK